VRTRPLEWNPMPEVDLPKAQRHELQVPQAAARAALLGELERDEFWPLWCLMITTGLRPGEALALTWADVDLDVGQVTVRRALAWLKGGAPQIAEPKTNAGRRSVPLPAETINVLRRHRARQLEDRFKLGEFYQDQGFVFADGLGKPRTNGSTLQAHFQAARKRAALTCAVCGKALELTAEGRPAHLDNGEGHTPAASLELLRFRVYDLRHLHASLLLARGIDLKTVSQRLGHANAGFTLETYTHVVPGTQAAAAVVIGEEVFGRNGRQTK
jgi:integrase